MRVNDSGGLHAQVAQRLEDTVDLLRRLIAEPSVEGSAAIGRCLEIIAEQVAPFARACEWFRQDGVPSLLVRFGDPEPRTRLLFSGHVDVVPVDERWWTTPPFELRQRNGRLYGRGTCDMKGGIAAFVTALRILQQSGDLEGCSIDLLLTGDEEVGSERGTIPVLRRGRVRARTAICGEPTGLAVFLGNRGLVWVRIVVRGRGGHAGLSHVLANPIPAAARIVSALHALELDMEDPRFEPSRPSLNVTAVDANAARTAPNVIPDVVTLIVDRRLLPGEDPDDAVATIERTVHAHLDPGCGADITVLRRWPPCMIDAGEPAVSASAEALRATGRPVRIGADLAANDASWLDAAGIPTVLLGPGDPALAHVSDEYVPVAQLRDAIEIYARIAAGLARRGGSVHDSVGSRGDTK